MNYIEINFNAVKGFNKLAKAQRKLFTDTYKKHNSLVGSDYKEGWSPVKVEWVKENPSKYSYLRVEFKNGNWLHYTQKGEWY
ncbi:MAG TPA: hypothetical protein GX519_07115 [Thermoanaerobacterales bacterium]|nr:hypothetical protein [Thermoanaerobacterales bacterium]